MDNILAGQTPDVADILAAYEPTAEELAAIEREMPRIEAELELLDVQISTLDRRRELDEFTVRRIRRARRKVAARGIAQIDAIARRTTPATEVTA